MKKEIITWEQFQTECKELARLINQGPIAYKNIYPVLRAGAYVALELSKHFNIPVSEELTPDSLVVDDIVDSGRTIAQFKDNDTATLHYKKRAKVKPKFYLREVSDWVVYPWESQEEGPEENIVRILEYIGEDPNREGLLDTPKRVVKSYKELFGGYNQDPKDLFRVFSADGYDQMIISKDIEFYSFCEHHMLPFWGKVHIAYIPKEKVIGLSKLARIVEVYARRLQIQEQLTNQIANAINNLLKPWGVAVVIEGQHMCQAMRGVQKKNAMMVTSAMLGNFKKQIETREEFLNLIK